MLDQILQRVGFKYEDLNASERETLMGWMEMMGKSQITVERIRTYLISMRDAVEQELCKTEHNSKQDLLLKARLRNYMLLEAFLTTPEKAKAAMERQLAGLGKK